MIIALNLDTVSKTEEGDVENEFLSSFQDSQLIPSGFHEYSNELQMTRCRAALAPGRAARSSGRGANYAANDQFPV